ncbi:hypothetical protein C8R45DRAFT_928977 [Mycena sanguinolenta]|nr:hypothetical protein C8R45DRAFT_928977 [Mycena sanguinolenta]
MADNPMAGNVPIANPSDDEEEGYDARLQLYEFPDDDINMDDAPSVPQETPNAEDVVPGTFPTPETLTVVPVVVQSLPSVTLVHETQALVPSVPQNVHAVAGAVLPVVQQVQAIVPRVTQTVPTVAGTSRCLDEQNPTTKRRIVEVPPPASERAVNDAIRDRVITQEKEQEARRRRQEANNRIQELEEQTATYDKILKERVEEKDAENNQEVVRLKAEAAEQVLFDEAIERAIAYDAQRQDQTAKTSRKWLKWAARKTTVEKMIKILLVKPRKDGSNREIRDKIAAWRFLEALLKLLPTQAMSSEEVDNRDVTVDRVTATVKIHKVMICPWCHERIRHYMQWVDETGLSMKINSDSTRPRVWVEEEGQSLPPPQLLLGVYSEQWLAEEREYDDDLDNTLEISNEVFKLLKLASKTFQIKPNSSDFQMATSSISSSKAELSCPTVLTVSAHTGHYCARQDLFSVYKGSRGIVLKTPTPQEGQCCEPLAYNPDFRSPAYITPRMPYHAIILKYNPWHGPLLDVLDYTFESLPIIQYSEWWALDPDVVQEWRDFEDCLRSVGLELPWLSSKPFPPRMEPWFIAGRYHYSLYYRTKKEVCSASWRYRKKFLPLLGYASMGLWFMAHEEADDAEAALGIISGSKCEAENLSELKSVKRSNTERRPEQPPAKLIPWRQALAEKLNILPSWIDTLEIILKSGAPILPYFIWGPIPRTISIGYAVPQYIQHLCLAPNSQQIDRLIGLPGDMAFSPLTLNDNRFQPVGSSAASVPPRTAPKAPHDRGFQPTRSSTSIVPARATAETDLFIGEDMPLDLSLDDHEDTLLEFPPVHPTSGQRHGERMEHYFVRWEQQNARKLAKETPQDKAARIQRADNTNRGRAPGKKSARVYVWAKEETDNGFYIRRPEGRNNYESLFEDYPPSQRRYDSFHDEWDLCSAFSDDKENGPSDCDSDFRDNEDYYGYLEATTNTPVVRDAHNALPLVDRIYLDFGPDSAAQDGSPVYQPFAGDLNTALYKRFGFFMGQSQRIPSRVPEMSVVVDLVGQQDIGAHFVDVMATFFGQCLEAKSSDDLDQALFDLHHRDRSPLFKPWPFLVRRENLTNTLDKSSGVYYVLCDNGSSLGSETLLLQRAADGMEIIRQRLGSQCEGCRQKPLNARDALLNRCHGVNRAYAPKRNRDSGSSPSSCQRGFGAWLSPRKLLHPRRGRIALPYGGVIGRIVRSEVTDDDVLRGPSADVFEMGVCLWDGRSNHAYWHESLTEHEIDLICGVYYVATDPGVKSEAGAAQTRLLSWWLKPLVEVGKSGSWLVVAGM